MQVNDIPVKPLMRAFKVGLAVARAAWRSRYNRLWRFSKFKWVLVTVPVQLLIIVGLSHLFGSRRSGFIDPSSGYAGIALLLLVQFGWSGLIQGFLNGQYQLFRGSLVPLFEVSSAPPVGFLVGRMLEHLPRRIWSGFLWAWTYASVLPMHGGFLLLTGYTVLAALIGSIAFLTGLLALLLWQAYAPHGVRYGLSGSMILQIALLAWVGVYLTEGGTLQGVFAVLNESRHWIVSLIVGIGALPGIFLLGLTLVRPHAVDRIYRKGLFQLFEMDQRSGRAKRSLYLPLSNAMNRAVFSKEWISLIRAPFTWIRLLAFAAGLVSEAVIGHASYLRGGSHSNVILLAVPLLSWLLTFSVDVIMAFPGEGTTFSLYRMAGVSIRRILFAKGFALWVPSIFLITAALAVGCVAEHVTILDGLKLELWGWLGFTSAMAAAYGISAGYLDSDPEEVGQMQNSPGAGQMGIWGLVGMAAAILPIAILLYLRSGIQSHLGLQMLLWCMQFLLPGLSIGWGYKRLQRRYL